MSAINKWRLAILKFTTMDELFNNKLTTAISTSEETNFTGAVWQTEDGGFVTSSLKVAEYFGKNHQHVLELIREKRSVENSTDLWFADSTYKDAYGRDQKMVLMNQNGFMFIVFGYTTKKADQIKVGYINEFERMRKQQNTQIDYFSPEFVTGALKAIQQYQIENQQLKNKIENDAPKITLYQKLLQTTNGYEIEHLSKMLDFPATFLREYLANKKVIFKRGKYWDVYAKYTSWFNIQLTPYEAGGMFYTRPKLMVIPTGIEHIFKMLIKDGLLKPDTIEILTNKAM